MNDCGEWEDTTTFYILHFCFMHMLIRVCAVFCVSFASSLTSALMKSHFLVDFLIIIPSPPPYDDALITSAITPAD